VHKNNLYATKKLKKNITLPTNFAQNSRIACYVNVHFYLCKRARTNFFFQFIGLLTAASTSKTANIRKEVILLSSTLTLSQCHAA